MSKRAISHFKRAIAIFAAIGAAMKLDGADRLAALAAIGPYRSRGKGGKRNPMQRQVLGRQMQDRSKYKPHQGAQERLRRVLGGWSRSRVQKRQAIAQARAIGAKGMRSAA